MAFRLLPLFAACSVSFFISCSVRPPPRPVVLPSSALLLRSEQDFLAQLTRQRQAIRSVRGVTRVTYRGAQETGTARQAVAAQAPNQFRLELFSLLGIAALTTCNGEILTAYFPSQKVLYRGQATPFAIARFTQMMLSAQEVTDLLLGIPPITASTAQAAVPTVTLDAERGWHRIEFMFAEVGSQVLWFDARTTLLQQWERLGLDGQVLARLQLAEYQKIHGLDFPREILLKDHVGQQELGLYYEQVELNPALAESLFTIPAVPGVQEIIMQAGNLHSPPEPK